MDENSILNTKVNFWYTRDGGMTTISSNKDIVDRVPSYYEFYRKRQQNMVFAYILSKIKDNEYKIDSIIKQDIDNALKLLSNTKWR